MKSEKLQIKNENLPNGWRKVKLGEIVNVRRGASPRPIHKYISKSGMPWLKIGDITSIESRFVDSTKEFIKEEGIKKSVIVHPGDLILSNSATPGIPKFMKITACVHDGWLILEPKSQQINKEFLYYKLIIDREKLVSSVTGAIFDNLKTEVLREHEILLPSEDEQKRIADILSAFDDKIELNNKIIKILEEMAQEVFKEKFNNSEKLIVNSEKLKSEKWKIKYAEDVFVFEKGIEPGSKYYSETKKEGYVPFYRVRDLDKQGGVDVYIPEKIANGKICKANDVLLSLDATVGRVKIGCNGAFSSGIRKVYSKDGLIKNSFIYFWLKTPYIQNTILEHASGTTILHAGQAIKYLKIPFNKEIIKEIQSKVDPMFEKILQILKENQKLVALRDLLLPRLMSGEILVNS
jgi:type I restriction enzyme S subunit